MTSSTHICMLAAENGAIPGGKVGGIGDVIRDIPIALTQTDPQRDITVTILIPSYGSLHLLPQCVSINAYTTRFKGQTERIELYEWAAGKHDGIRYLILHNPLFAACGQGKVYCNDAADQPFATDANKFALFCSAAITAINDEIVASVNVIHLHDWHAALAAVLIQFDARFARLRSLPCIYSIHNLALQGVRPFADDESSLQSWYPWLNYDPQTLADPRWTNCINPVAAAIRLSSRVHTVSANYAHEIVLSNNAETGFHGGEGLEDDLQQAADQHRLVGILNGISYPKQQKEALSWPRMLQAMAAELLSSLATDPQLKGCDYLAHQRLLAWQAEERPTHIVTSVGRLTDQKAALLLHKMDGGQSVLERMLQILDDSGLIMVLGTGDIDLEKQCMALAASNNRLLFINRFSEQLSDLLFRHGDLFLMPSLFEPCGISQMIAMRHGQPVLAHAVGGLADTINDDEDGFLFQGKTLTDKAAALIQRFSDVVKLRETNPGAYTVLSKKAASQRFHWHDSAARYLKELYQ